MKSEVSSQSKILIFIKTKPILFGLIVTGIIAVITLAITLPVIMTKKDNDDDIDKGIKEKEDDDYDDIDKGIKEEEDDDSDKGIKENNEYILPEYYNVIPIGKEKIFDFNTIKATSDAKK